MVLSNISTTVRIACGLTLLTVSLLLLSGLLGLIPDQNQAKRDSRLHMVEFLAIAVTLEISEGNSDRARELIEIFEQRNKNVSSVNLDTLNQNKEPASNGNAEPFDNLSSTIIVPVNRNGSRWGHLIVNFNTDERIFAILGNHPLAVTVGFMALCGFLSYWIFLKQALTELDPSAVVPDRVNAVLDTLAEGIVMIDRSGKIVMTNEAFRRKTDSSNSNLIGVNLSRLSWEPNATSVYTDTLPWDRLLNSSEKHSSNQLIYQCANEKQVYFSVNVASVQSPQGKTRGAVVTFDDVTELQINNANLTRALEHLASSQREIEHQNNELRFLATRDPLTNALNRRSFFEGLQALFDDPGNQCIPIGCIMTDLDHFKSVNDDFGHATGDKVIKLLASVLHQCVPKQGLVGRYGGEEFCIALPGLDEQQSARVAEQIRLNVSEQSANVPDLGLRRITASLGVSVDTDRMIAVDALVDLADKALYVAKESGRNRVICYSQLQEDHDEFKPLDESLQLAVNQEDSLPSSAIGITKTSSATSSNALINVGNHVSEISADSPKDADAEEIHSTLIPVMLADELAQAVELSTRLQTSIAALVIDFPTLQLVWSTVGERSAAKLLEIARERINAALRSTDTTSTLPGPQHGVSLSRLGAGQYIALLTDIDDPSVIPSIVKRVYATLKAPVDVNGREILVDARVGISIYPNDDEDGMTLITKAIGALRKSMSSRTGNTCTYYSKELHQRSVNFMSMQSQLHGALMRNEIFLMYQPLVDMRTSRVSSLEALIRWQHPQLGMVSPEMFIPVAEQTGLINEIGDWVIRTACRQLKSWHDSGFTNLTIAVNLAASQLYQHDLVKKVAAVIKDSGVDPTTLTIELTETTLIENFDTAVSIVKELSQTGVRIALDDFGTGYSSLSYLRYFPIDVVKIDRSFFTHFPDDKHSMSIVSNIISMVHSLGLKVVAEGIETNSQLAFLQCLDIDVVQGYLFSAALTDHQTESLLANPEEIRRKFFEVSTMPTARRDARAPVIEGVLSEAPGRRIH